MCSRLQSDETSRYPLKGLLHRFRCHRHFLFQKDSARFIQNAVARPAIAEVHTNRELVSFENHVSIYPNSANLFHCRSPFHCALSTSNIGSVSHPAETGLLISSGKFYKGRSQEKTPLRRPDFSLLLSPGDEAGSVLTARTRCSVAGYFVPAIWGSPTSGFHRFFATKPVSSETSKAERGQIWRP